MAKNGKHSQFIGAKHDWIVTKLLKRESFSGKGRKLAGNNKKADF
ncbi:hypothetical protein [Sphingobacterium humi]|nr:hypothetical protein [Sphingobacterium humi]